MIPSLYQPVTDPMETIKTIQAVGAQRCIIGSDFGQCYTWTVSMECEFSYGPCWPSALRSMRSA